MFASNVMNIMNVVFVQPVTRILNMTIPALNITLWQFFMAIFMLGFVLKIVLSLMNTTINGINYRSTSYHGKNKPYEPKANRKDGNNDKNTD